MSEPRVTGLVRTIGRWTLAGLMLNGIIGSGMLMYGKRASIPEVVRWVRQA